MLAFAFSNTTIRQFRHMNCVLNLISNMQYIQEKQNVTVNYLTRSTEDKIKIIFEEHSRLNEGCGSRSGSGPFSVEAEAEAQ